MNLLRKYYDGLADLPTGGGIPDEDIIRNHIKAYIVNEIKQTHYKEISRLKESLSASERFRVMDAANAIDDQISQRDGMRMQINSLEDALMIKNSEVDALKAENERLRGEVNKLKTDNDNLGRHLPYRI